jgi:ATP-binding cassette, subfamily B (MDR/TAP), member 1
MEVGVRKGFINGLGFGATIFVLYGSYALAFWYGSSLVRAEEYTAGQLITVSKLVGESY